MDIRAVIQRHVVMIALSLCAGFAGSALHGWIGTRTTTIRAQRFEIVDASGRLLSTWGPDDDPKLPASTPKGTHIVFLDGTGLRRLQVGAATGDRSPEMMFYGTEGPMEFGTPKQSFQRPLLWVRLGNTGSPYLHMRGRAGDQVRLGVMEGDVSGEELGWGLSFRAWASKAKAGIGYSKVLEGKHDAGVSVTDGNGRAWSFPPYPGTR